MERLQKIISQAGVASRRRSERLMLEGRVTVNGDTVRELGTKADPARDDIRVDGRRIKLPERRRYILLNKPRGYVTTRSDPEKRPTVIDLLRGVREYVYPVGRLDFDSEGLLLLTNDGDLAAKLMHPSHLVERVYEVRVLGVPDQHDLTRLARGILVDGRRAQPAGIELVRDARHHSSRRMGPLPRARQDLSPGSRGPRSRSLRAAGAALERRLSHSGGGAPRPGRNDSPRSGNGSHRATAVLVIAIGEGRNRQVRKMCDAIGHPVDQLRRIAIGPIRDGRLKLGEWRELTPEEVRSLRKATETAPPRSARKEDGGRGIA
jgi:23S rRNA pseudouridine2605 synthase